MARARKPRYPQDPTGAWVPIPGRRSGSVGKVQLGRWLAVRGPKVRTYKLGRDAKGRFKRIVVPEAHYVWSEDRRLTYHAAGQYRLSGKKVDRSVVGAILSASVVKLPREARWLFYRGPHVVEYLGPERWIADGRKVSTVAAAYRLAESLVDRGVEITRWAILDAQPDFEDVAFGLPDHHFEIGTAEVRLEEIKGRYERMAGGRKTDDLEEERDVPFDQVSEDVLSEMRRAWADFETAVADREPFGKWLGQAKGIPVMISYYVVAHRIVYVDQEAVVWGETIQTRFVPFGRGDGYAELAARVQMMIDASDEEVTFVAGGLKLIFQELLT